MKLSKSLTFIVAITLMTSALSACSLTDSMFKDSGDSESEVTAEIVGDPEAVGEFDLEVSSGVQEPKVTITYEPLPSDGTTADGIQFTEFLESFINSTATDPAATKCSQEIQELMTQSPNVAVDLNTATPLYLQTQAQMDNLVFIRFAYEGENGTMSDLFTFEQVDGTYILTEPDRLASFVSGGVYELKS